MSATVATAPPRPVADALLDAVGELLVDRTWGEVRMVDVAERAGVSRQTLYNTFSTRHGLARAYASREADGFLDAVAVVIGSSREDPVAGLAEALALFLAAAETHPLVRAIAAAEEGDELLALFTTRGGPVLERLTARLSELIVANWPGVEPIKALAVADTLIRLAISHAALPGAPPREAARQIAELLGPAVEAEIASAGS